MLRLCPGVLPEQSVKKRGRFESVEAAYGARNTIVAKGSLLTKHGAIEVCEVENNTANLASVSVTCKRLNVKLMFTNTHVYEMLKQPNGSYMKGYIFVEVNKTSRWSLTHFILVVVSAFS